MKQIFLLLLALSALFALEPNSVITQEDLSAIATYLENYKQTYIGDSLYTLASLEQIPNSDILALKQKYCAQLPTFWEKVPECDCQKLNLAALTLKCEDKRRADLDYTDLSLAQLAYLTRTLTQETIPENLNEIISDFSLNCHDNDQSAILLAKMQLLKVSKGDSAKKDICLSLLQSQNNIKFSSQHQIENLIEAYGAMIIGNEEAVASKTIMKTHSRLVYKARNYLTERQFHKYRPRMMFAIMRSAIIMRNYQRLIVPSEIKLEKGTEQTFSAKVVNTLNEIFKDEFKITLVINRQNQQILELKATFDATSSRYVVIIPGELEIGDYSVKWSFNVPGFYIYSFTTKLTVMFGRLEVVRAEYDDGHNNYQEVAQADLTSAHFQVKESVGESGRVGIVIAGLQSIIPRYLALNLYKGSQLAYTILGTVIQNEELVSFYFPKFFEEEVIDETKFQMELVVGDRWVYNCPLYQKLGSITLPGSKSTPPPMIPSKYQPKELLYWEYGQTKEEPPAIAVYGMIILMLMFVLYFLVLSRPLKLNCEKWNTNPQKSMQLGFVLCLILIVGTMVAFFLGLKLIPTLQILALLGKFSLTLALPTIFFISKALSGLQIIDY